MKEHVSFLLLVSAMLAITMSRTYAHDGTHLILMDDTGYEPSSVEVTQGETVEFRNIGTADKWPASSVHPTHSIYPAFDPKGPVPVGESWSFTFDTAGVWRFHDHLVPTISGEIVVSSPQLESSGEEVSTFELLSLWIKKVLHNFLQMFSRGHLEPEVRLDTSKQMQSNPGIEASSTVILTDLDALRSYLLKFGTQKTMTHLGNLTAQGGTCHDVSHEVGKMSYELDGEKAFADCTTACRSGCYHGVIAAYLIDHGTENIRSELNTICSSSLGSFLRSQCIHGVGHGLAAWTDYDIPQSLKTCDTISNDPSSCWTGVFMENISGAFASQEIQSNIDETGTHLSTYLSDDPHYPCTVVDDMYKGSCYYLQTTRMMQLFNNDFRQVADACAHVPDTYRMSCFKSMGRDALVQYRTTNLEAVIDTCHIPTDTEARNSCLSEAVQVVFSSPSDTEVSSHFCTLLTDTHEKTACYTVIFTRAPELLTTSDELQTFCNTIEPDYVAQCVRSVNLE